MASNPAQRRWQAQALRILEAYTAEVEACTRDLDRDLSPLTAREGELHADFSSLGSEFAAAALEAAIP